MTPDLDGQVALITGGTRGIGLATGLALAEHGADVVLTHAWGSVPDEEVTARFRERRARPPLVVQADAGHVEDTATLLDQLARQVEHVDVFVSNASMATAPRSLEDYDERSLLQSVSRGAWPLVAYARGLHDTFGVWPRYLVAISSDGPDAFSFRYDFAAAAKAVLETLVRYLSWHLRGEGVTINAVRSRAVRTASFEAQFGGSYVETAARYASEDRFVEAEDVADAVVGLCSGLMDAVNGQVLTVDRGTAFDDNLMRLFEARHILPG